MSPKSVAQGNKETFCASKIQHSTISSVGILKPCHAIVFLFVPPFWNLPCQCFFWFLKESHLEPKNIKIRAMVSILFKIWKARVPLSKLYIETHSDCMFHQTCLQEWRSCFLRVIVIFLVCTLCHCFGVSCQSFVPLFNIFVPALRAIVLVSRATASCHGLTFLCQHFVPWFWYFVPPTCSPNNKHFSTLYIIHSFYKNI